MAMCPTAWQLYHKKNVFRPMREKKRLEKERSKLCIGRIHPLIRHSFLFFSIFTKILCTNHANFLSLRSIQEDYKLLSI